MILLSLTASCGMDVDVKDSEHKVDSNSKVEVSDSTHTVKIETTLDKILEICGIVKEDGTLLAYDEWTDENDECFQKLKMEGINGGLSRLQEEAAKAGLTRHRAG